MTGNATGMASDKDIQGGSAKACWGSGWQADPLYLPRVTQKALGTSTLPLQAIHCHQINSQPWHGQQRCPLHSGQIYRPLNLLNERDLTIS